MLTIHQALTALLNAAHASPILQTAADIETVPLLQAQHRVLAISQTAQTDVPPFDNAQMDGYAIKLADCVEGKNTAGTPLHTTLTITQRINAGETGQALEAGSAVRIFTGAALPAGADTVLMQEVCQVQSHGDKQTITFPTPSKAGQYVRYRGEDIKAGNVILAAGIRLQAAHSGLAAAAGLVTLPLVRRVRVAIFFTGDELINPGEPLPPGAIYNANRYTLHNLLTNLGCEITDYGIVPDTLENTRESLREAARQHDLILTSGGVSVGDKDYIKAALDAEGQLDLWKIAIKPGKPLAFGQVRRAPPHSTDPVFFIGLPGNPVSAFITFLIFVRPFILRLQSVADVTPQAFIMRADFDWLNPDKRHEFLRAQINPSRGLTLFANQSSAALTSCAISDGLIDNPPATVIRQGDLVRFIPFNVLVN